MRDWGRWISGTKSVEVEVEVEVAVEGGEVKVSSRNGEVSMSGSSEARSTIGGVVLALADLDEGLERWWSRVWAASV